MKTLFKIIISLFIVCALSACHDAAKKRIGIVLPLEHKALNDIVTGFSDKLREIYHEPVQIKVLNAQGDVNLQRAIIQQMRDQSYDLIVPVSTSVTQMTASMVRDKPIVSLAADFSEKNRQNRNPCNIAVVHDEIPPEKLIQFIHTAYPQLKHLTLIHSTLDKIFPDVNTVIASGKKLGIEIKPIMVTNLPELMSATQSLSNSTEGIFVLKDSLIVSGIATLAHAAQARHIPLFTSDQGSVQSGAGFSLGVHEREIGEEGAKMAAAVLTGQKICNIPIKEMQALTVFINKNALQQENQNLNNILETAKRFNYSVEFV